MVLQARHEEGNNFNVYLNAPVPIISLQIDVWKKIPCPFQLLITCEENTGVPLTPFVCRLLPWRSRFPLNICGGWRRRTSVNAIQSINSVSGVTRISVPVSAVDGRFLAQLVESGGSPIVLGTYLVIVPSFSSAIKRCLYALMESEEKADAMDVVVHV